MRCAYYKWQLVFTDIINNNELSIPYCDWLCLSDTCMLCCTPNGTHDLIVHWTLALIPLLLFIYVIAFLMIWLFYCYIVLHHFICTCIFPLIFTHLLGVLTPWICISRSIYVTLLIRYLGLITCVTRSSEFSLFDYPIWLVFLVFPVYSYWFFISFELSLFYWLFIE